MNKFKRVTAWLLVCFLTIAAGHLNVLAVDGTNEAQALVNYLMVEEPVLTAPGTQRVMIGIGDEDTVIDTATLSYRSGNTGQVYETEAAEILEGFVLFEMEFKDESLKDTYQLEQISYTVGGETMTPTF